MDKKEIRSEFSKAVLERDGFACVMCGYKPLDSKELDAHHICDRNLMPYGGYISCNGITLCTDRSSSGDFKSNDCHRKAEQLHEKGFAYSGYSPAELYDKIGRRFTDVFLLSLTSLMDAPDILRQSGLFFDLVTQEVKNCTTLSEKQSEESWILTCELYSEKNRIKIPLEIAKYGKAREYATNDGTERRSSQNHQRN